MPILITGGAGYIGSHMVKYFQENNEEVTIIDNLQSESMKIRSKWTIFLR